MATLTNEQVEQKMKQLQQLSEEVSALTKELVEAGAIELSEEDLEKVDGGSKFFAKFFKKDEANGNFF